ncbi:rubrerythrin family protein [Acetatifactor muris]|jgi:rubrerythrin|uniref:Rubrerythrin-1 n=1 Tax=Acetatifactor muris TaxID=879566 RepID=A0A2K4ZJI2_9FIRM|nr:rubrerythrin family protein [Acetatifactor muris]MCI8798226.1 rubrerythrin family protein [Lachnospiraceae bacterium]MCR2048912.1 rubrerythrin family protein [Acetatifactor muris]SOY30620.1 Rubrerythrin-1 [Acetatifactor muris]
MTEFINSTTKDNLMRAFAGESQARNRYTFAASQAKKNGLHVISAVFAFTAAQEKEHAEIFYQHLKEMAGNTIFIDGGYPVDISDNMADLLDMARHNEYEEHDSVYQSFGQTAKQEGFDRIAASFLQIAEIEKIHGDRFGRYAQLLREGKLFVSDVEEEWMCLNCGFVFKGTKAPQICPVCQHDRGYFIRFELAPYEGRFQG